MSNIVIAKNHEAERGALSFLADLTALSERIRERAYTIFEGRGAAHGQALDDWLQAENDLRLATEFELTEKDSKFQLRIAVPGFTEKQIEVTALPGALIVRARAALRHEQKENSDHLSETTEKDLFHRFDLPAAIDLDNVTARLDKGTLRITAPRARQTKAVASTA